LATGVENSATGEFTPVANAPGSKLIRSPAPRGRRVRGFCRQSRARSGTERSGAEWSKPPGARTPFPWLPAPAPAPPVRRRAGFAAHRLRSVRGSDGRCRRALIGLALEDHQLPARPLRGVELGRARLARLAPADRQGVPLDLPDGFRLVFRVAR